MFGLLKNDLYRIKKTSSLYIMLFLSFFISLFFLILNSKGIKLGIYVLEASSNIKETNDIALFGLKYQILLGLFVAIIISLFIGQEYRWKTWKLKIVSGFSHNKLFISKLICSSLISISIFLVYQIIILLYSRNLLSLSIILNGVFVYAALGSIVCFISIIIKNDTISIVVSICYVLLGETFINSLKSLFSFSDIGVNVYNQIVKHTLPYIVSNISLNPYSITTLTTTILNTSLIIGLITILGLTIFRKYEF